MGDASDQGDFDSRPPMPVSEYERTVKRVNIGYDLIFKTTKCFLRALDKPELHLLVVGAGGGMEIESFLPENPGWRITGVDPSKDMLELAQAKAERFAVRDRVTLIRGSIADLPESIEPFDAGTCLFVIHFVPGDAKRELLQGIKRRLRSDAPLFTATPTNPDSGGMRAEFLSAWQKYGESMGMPAEQMASTIQRTVAQLDPTTQQDYVNMMHAAGFAYVQRYLEILGAIAAWMAR